MLISRYHPVFLLQISAIVALPLFLASCGSSKRKVKGVPANLPTIDLHGSAATPVHSMSHHDYPFDPSGNYVTAWAAEGETRAGRGAGSASDYSSWKSSHSGSSSRSSSTVKKKTNPSKSSSSSKKKSSSRLRVTVKSGDTLSGLARRYGSSVSAIKSANGLRSDLIRNGQTLTIPR